MDSSHTGILQASTGKPVEIRLPAAIGIGREAPDRIPVACRELLEHLATDFIGALADAGPDPRQYLHGVDTHASDGRFKHATRQSPPSRVDRSYACTQGVAQEHRQAVGGEDHAWLAWPRRDRTVRGRGRVAGR